jgi:hypothetical protein
MGRFVIEGRPFNQALFGGASNKTLSLSFRPELLVDVRCGGVRLGSFDAWEQRDNDSIGWDYNSNVDAAALDEASPDTLPSPDDQPVSIPMSRHFVTLPQGLLKVRDLANATQGAGVGLIVDANLASQSVSVTNGIFDGQVLVESVCKCLRLRALPITDPANAQPQYVITGPPAGEDQRLTNAAVDRQIKSIWSPVIYAAGSARGSDFSPFSLAQFARFSTIRYGQLTDQQRACVDRVLDLISTRLTDEQRQRIEVALRPGLVAQGRVGGDLASTIEESATTYGAGGN